MALLTDEEYNALFDEVAANDSLTPEQMDALTKMRDDMYERMTYMKDNESYREKYDGLERRYRERWNDERKPIVKEVKEDEEEKTDVSYETLFGEEE